ncbi:hypothetical protein [Parvicella tangerina]|uniref:Uncharacterized protein n=1 Tax=Parvicella tangerina TaxID=2829795 RepID=A0A916NDH3_9FLAO|nr:hypothetical protein [Parvicella tangerina]CAG5086700.1 hypothetical protein CRYO30217_03247 [Parvicella tangerina]
MKTLLSLIVVLIGLGLHAQEVFTVTGKVQHISYYQGGAQLSDEMMSPKPLPNTKLYIVQYYGPKEKTKVVSSFTSDKNGNYEVKLPPGLYGFVLSKDEANTGIYLPGMKVTKKDSTVNVNDLLNAGEAHQDYWILSTNGPFEVINKDLYNVDLTHYDVTICYMCP